MSHTDEYIVRLEAFEGPMDLLLHLIKRAEVEITDIPIAAITDQYVERLRGLERVDIELAGEFLVMAATLMEIKSRMLAPEAPGEAGATDGPEPARRDDPRADLIRQLLEYKRVRDAASALDALRETWERRFPTAPAGYEAAATDDAALDVDDLELFDLVQAFARIAETVDLERAARGVHEVAYDDTPIELHAEDLLDRLRREASQGRSSGLSLREMLRGRARGEVIGLFLAMLELIRRRRITVRADEAAAPAVPDYLVTINDDPDGDDAPAGVIESNPSQRAAGEWDDDDIFDDSDDDGDDEAAKKT